MLRTARHPRPPPVRTLPARERGPSKDVYVVVDWRPLKDEDTDTSAKKAKHRPMFDTSPKKLSTSWSRGQPSELWEQATGPLVGPAKCQVKRLTW